MHDSSLTSSLSASSQLRVLADALRDYAVISMDPAGVITGWGDGARRLLGHGEAEAAGRHFSMLFTPADRAAGLPERELRTAAEQGRAADENWAVRKDGSTFWASGTSTA